ncbi:MAG: serine acetyltransferase [Deltaproteobacteria bacterium]|nr:serine acetyltransferase [Deltaproteobacteria bacterium]
MRLLDPAWELLEPLLTRFALHRHGDIWKIHELLQREPPDRLLLRVHHAWFARRGSWVGRHARFTGVPCFPHGPRGIFISDGASIGRNVVIFQQVTIGSDSLPGSTSQGSPTIGDRVYIGAGAKIIGKVTVGDSCRIGANAVVCQDLPPHSVAVAAPTRVIQKADLDNRHYSIGADGWVYFDDGRWIPDPAGPGPRC